MARETMLAQTQSKSQGDERTAKDGDERTAKDGDERTAKDGDERTAKEGNQRTAKDGDERTAKDGDERTAKDGDQRTAKEGDQSTMNDFVTKLMKKMTLEEKLGQLNLLSIGFDVTGPTTSEDVDKKIRQGLVGAVLNTCTPTAIRKLQDMAVNESRLKIPMFFGFDVIHGYQTIFPINLGLAASWDMDLIERMACVEALEASADGINWAYAPMVDIARDPRWGRVSEGSGEDPYLGSQIAQAMVRGLQGKDYKDAKTVMACVKHFALYGAAEAGRDYNTVDMSRVRMYNEYLPPYKAAIDAGVASVMSSFNEIDGVSATGNKWLMTDLLRKQWGFKGFVATDYTAVSEMIAHGVGDEEKVAELSLNAGIDMDMVSDLFVKYGEKLVKSGAVKESQIDDACRRILEAKYKLGLFDDPYRYINETRCKYEMMTPDKLQLSKEAALKSVVLLKNANQTLPLRGSKRIAFIGPLVKDKRNLIGSWYARGDFSKAVSIWEALGKKFGADKLGADKFLYSKGCNLLEESPLLRHANRDGAEIVLDEKSFIQMMQEAVATAEKSDVLVVCLGEAGVMTGEAASRSMIGLPENQLELLKALKKTGKPLILVLMNGRPLTLGWEDQNADAILETWFLGTMAGAAIVDVLFGDASPEGKLTMSFPRNEGQVPIYYNHKNTGRPSTNDDKYASKYLDIPNDPLYPFGYGLSYTTFNYGDVKLSNASVKPHETFSVSVPVTNTGTRDGVEIVQLYVRDLVGSITRPVKELKGFQKVALKPGETKTATFMLTSEDLRFYDADMRYVAELGDFKVMVGPNCRDVKEASFKLIP
jgi:beta-glucosidase